MHILSNLFDIAPADRVATRRSSSYDRSGANIDFRRLPAGGRLPLLDVEGPGIVTHLWFALAHMDYNYLRALRLQAWWDGEPEPSIDCPLGDFFGVGHAAACTYRCLLQNMVRGGGCRGESTGVNSYIPMPFLRHARIEVVNESAAPCMACYYIVDWLQTDADAVAGAGRFHAQWRRENPVPHKPASESTYAALGRFGANLDGKDNFLVADIQGRGRFLGMNFSVDNVDDHALGNPVGAFGEGDEMIFLDGESWPPSLHGTGTEDYFTHAWGMTGESGLYAGVSYHQPAQPPRRERGTCYRFHVLDPVYFRRSLRFTFEHGVDNCQANDLAGTAYWYQDEPHAPYTLPPFIRRRPQPQPGDPNPDEEDVFVAYLGEVVNAWYDVFIEGTRAQVEALGQGLAAKLLGQAFSLRDRFRDAGLTRADAIAQLEPHAEAVRRIRGDRGS